MGRADPGITQLEHSIVGQKRHHQLRVATVDTILSLAELRQDGSISLDEAVALVKPTTVRVDDIVGILTRVAAQADVSPNVDEHPQEQQLQTEVFVPQPIAVPAKPISQGGTRTKDAEERLYLLTPVSNEGDMSGQDIIRRLLDRKWYVFGDRTTGRKDLKPGDHICFYESGVGVVAEAQVDSRPEHKTIPHVHHPEKFPWAFKVKDVRYFFDKPVVVDAALRVQLDAFKGRDPEGPWAWLVQGTRKVSAHDFHVLTGCDKK